MNKPTPRRLRLRPLTVRIFEIDPDDLAGGNLRTNATQQDACSGTCTCTNPSICLPCRP